MKVHAPAGETELADLVRHLAATGTPVEVAGGRTRLGLGHPVEAMARITTAAMTGITLYEPAALTIVVRAGTPLAEVEAALAAEGQHLPFEPADHRALLGSRGTPTIGGAYATGVSGPRRVQAGACRDCAIGVRLVSGAGDVVANGGRVMKNVTGYDLVKLICGSFGTLGVVTEIAFKVLPRPEMSATLTLAGLDEARAVAALSRALASPYGVSGAAHLAGGGDGPLTLLRIEGFAASVDYRAARLRELLAAFGEATVDTDQVAVAAGWRRLRDVEVFAGRPGAVWRLSVKPTDAPLLVGELRRRLADTQALYDWGGGLVWLLVAEEGDCGAAAIRGLLARFGGHATLVRAGQATRRSVAVFEPQAPGIAALADGLRRRFDPSGILNPGRMAAVA
ncbi:MAG: 2-hydroxy-acid oxidase [Alphaproteobacteria bacterium]|nr:MAG: 2-hydroxy-acid oxidase [Alphaproteobacteria bacterium]